MKKARMIVKGAGIISVKSREILQSDLGKKQLRQLKNFKLYRKNAAARG